MSFLATPAQSREPGRISAPEAKQACPRSGYPRHRRGELRPESEGAVLNERGPTARGSEHGDHPRSHAPTRHTVHPDGRTREEGKERREKRRTRKRPLPDGSDCASSEFPPAGPSSPSDGSRGRQSGAETTTLRAAAGPV